MVMTTDPDWSDKVTEGKNIPVSKHIITGS